MVAVRADFAVTLSRRGGPTQRVEAERESARAALTKAGEKLERERVERAKAESTARTLQAELSELRVESRQALGWRRGWSVRPGRRPGSKSLRNARPSRMPSARASAWENSPQEPAMSSAKRFEVTVRKRLVMSRSSLN